jgi:hypothetical protein
MNNLIIAEQNSANVLSEALRKYTHSLTEHNENSNNQKGIERRIQTKAINHHNLDVNYYLSEENANGNTTVNISDSLLYKKNKSRKVFFSNTQRWIGHIIDFDSEIITAKLKDINNPTTNEVADFYIKEIPIEDRKLISLGAAFYWSVGYANDENGQIKKESMIRFQRLAFTQEQYDKVLDSADAIYEKFRKWS